MSGLPFRRLTGNERDKTVVPEIKCISDDSTVFEMALMDGKAERCKGIES